MTLPDVPQNLAAHCASGGCGAKIGPGELAALLAGLPKFDDPRLLAGFDGSEDAAVYELTPELALVATADFFPPMVDDPRLFGQAAAANALSDVYAMGGRPLVALNLVCFPRRLDRAILAEILQGGAEKIQEAGAVVGGGHSIYDREPKYGLAVTGLVDPRKFRKNRGARPGDALLLTKALGVGLILAARRAGLADEAEYQAAAASMTRLNRRAAENLDPFPLHAVTDVTGFGLLGHLDEMAGDSLTMVLDIDSVPALPGALRCAADFLATAGGQRNRNHLAARVDLSALSAAQAELLFDPQTSGGLLAAVPAEQAEAALEAVRRDDPAATLIGQVEPRQAGLSAVVL
ncbi:MAG: selenide, water dikinase SelD [Deltaproteobacteria bacterium]|jgi:selenide,water dikinase|nr:selenide, water dikinase SelD [Deltaproteobacteria bacterium]